MAPTISIIAFGSEFAYDYRGKGTLERVFFSYVCARIKYVVLLRQAAEKHMVDVIDVRPSRWPGKARFECKYI
jgi:hypothetical protein